MWGDGYSSQLRFRYHSESGSAYIREITGRSNNKLKEFHYRLWFVDEKVPLDAAVTQVFHGERAQVGDSQMLISSMWLGIMARVSSSPREDRQCTHGFQLLWLWKFIIKAIFPEAIDGELLKLVYLFS